MQESEIKQYLIKRLKQANAFWSYDVSAIKDVPDDILVELVIMHLDLDDIDKLFIIYSYQFVKNRMSFLWVTAIMCLINS